MGDTADYNDFSVANAGEVNGLTWYRTTELANDLVREMISYYGREIMKEENNFYNKRLKPFAQNHRNDSTKAEIRIWCELLRNKKMLFAWM